MSHDPSVEELRLLLRDAVTVQGLCKVAKSIRVFHRKLNKSLFEQVDLPLIINFLHINVDHEDIEVRVECAVDILYLSYPEHSIERMVSLAQTKIAPVICDILKNPNEKFILDACNKLTDQMYKSNLPVHKEILNQLIPILPLYKDQLAKRLQPLHRVISRLFLSEDQSIFIPLLIPYLDTILSSVGEPSHKYAADLIASIRFDFPLSPSSYTCMLGIIKEIFTSNDVKINYNLLHGLVKMLNSNGENGNNLFFFGCESLHWVCRVSSSDNNYAMLNNIIYILLKSEKFYHDNQSRLTKEQMEAFKNPKRLHSFLKLLENGRLSNENRLALIDLADTSPLVTRAVEMGFIEEVFKDYDLPQNVDTGRIFEVILALLKNEDLNKLTVKKLIRQENLYSYIMDAQEDTRFHSAPQLEEIRKYLFITFD